MFSKAQLKAATEGNLPSTLSKMICSLFYEICFMNIKNLLTDENL